MATNTKSKNTNTVSKTEYDKMKKQFEDLQNLVMQMVGNNLTNLSANVNSGKIDNNKDITLTSLTVGELNLSTEGRGQGEIYTFSKFGEEQVIPYEDLKKIIKNNKKFIENGSVFINDDEVIKEQRLTNVYKKLLSYEEINKLFNEDKQTFEKIFQGMTSAQKETLRGIIYDKLDENIKSVDMNIVQILNDDLGIDIMNDYKNQKELFKEINN